MAANTSVMKGPKDVVAKTRLVTRSMTTGTAIMTLPKGARPLYAVISGVESDSATSASVSLGTTTTANELVSAHDVKTAASGRHAFMVTGAATAFGVPFTANTTIYAKYAEVGAANQGAWYVTVFYTQGNVTNDDTL